MCDRIVQNNLGSVAELTHSHDGHLKQFFVVYHVCIQGFVMGCRPIITIDPSHMSGPHGGAINVWSDAIRGLCRLVVIFQM